MAQGSPERPQEGPRKQFCLWELAGSKLDTFDGRPAAGPQMGALRVEAAGRKEAEEGK